MTGLAARGHSVRVVRTTIEVTVLALGWLLGGTVGIGTLLYAVAIGPLTHVFIPLLEAGRAPARRTGRPQGTTAESNERPVVDAERS